MESDPKQRGIVTVPGRKDSVMAERKRQILLTKVLPYLVSTDEARFVAPERESPLDSPPAGSGSRWENVPLALGIRTTEGVLELTDRAAVSLKNGIYYIEVDETDTAPFSSSVREAEEVRRKLLALALANARDLKRVGALFTDGGREETVLYDRTELKEECSRLLAPILPLLPALSEPEPVTVSFPYDSLRDGQRDLMDAVWNTVKTGGRLFVCAPTGIGKTSAVLYPALKALEKGKAEKIFYASPKNTLKAQVSETVALMRGSGDIHTLTLSAKMSLCPLGLEECLGRGCEYREDFLHRASPALAELYRAGFVGADEVCSAGEKYRLCPFELALKTVDFSEVIIGDYNHVFDPRFSVGAAGKDRILLVDESHNLPARIQESFTESLSPADLDPFFREETKPCQMLREHLEPLATFFAARRRIYREEKKDFSFIKPVEAAKLAEELLPKLRFVLGDGFGALSDKFRTTLRGFYRKTKRFSELCRAFGPDSAVIHMPDGGCKVYLAHPRDKIRAAADQWGATVFFSATLAPRDYYFSLLGGEEGDRFLTLSSPFPRENLFVALCPVDVSFSRRLESAKDVCGLIRATVRARPGNYMVFLPSFDYLDLVSQEYKRRYLDDRLLVQKRWMRREEREAFLEAFRTTRQSTLIGFCVMGGIFGEGIDLKGESLVGEILVGTGFPPPSAEAEAEAALYYQKEMDGRDFAYTLPGWSRVLQAAGRVIRDETDRGVIVLCDERYLQEPMRDLFPDAWEDARICENEEILKNRLARFWKES